MLRRVLSQTAPLSVILQPESGAPYALRVDVAKVRKLLRVLAILMGSFFLGTLLFVRELERSRALENQLLQLQIEKKLTENFSRSNLKVDEPAKPLPTPKASEVIPVPTVKAIQPAVPTVQARIGEISPVCFPTECVVKVSLMPSGVGVAQGHLIYVLETGIKRIGPATHTTEVRKRYFVFPGKEGYDALSEKQIGSFKGKRFKFSRALQTAATFEVGKLLSPMAVDVYVFDNAGKLVQKKRQTLLTQRPSP